MATTVILGGARTVFGSFLGSASGLSSTDLGSRAIRSALARSGLDPSLIDYVVMGQVLSAGAGQMPARIAAVRAGIPMNVPALSVNKVCLSGIQSIILASALIGSGAAGLVVAGGQESMSLAPRLFPRKASKFGAIDVSDHLQHDGLTDEWTGESMGVLADASAQSDGLSRKAMEEFAVESHLRAAAAWESGAMDDEVLSDADIPLARDESIRADATSESLARLRPAFAADGVITAGTSSPMTDGACALVLASKTMAQQLGLEWIAEIHAHGMVAGPDSSLPRQPSDAIRAALRTTSLSTDDLDILEINEAFASVPLTAAADLGVGLDRVNVNGGALAIGHPLGASGARLVLHLAMEMRRRGSGFGAAALCGGGGQGDALILGAPHSS
ncbi:acetyl-CoA C-acyltransferase [Arthrobacter sp. B2a2-09]|uniref:acetyl-CoA C-acyltransferase n=1 Tax=Arthrobacter sp. B2a2-09 TaxID=2952822 RepID=UPI0022CD9A1D|nr:acetyl-CoA C-acyltransferase [Arthrobacter sp. B2a2-09]MCZ9880601.1 acetyl-CoA C-acyltransferase [Arthrobacter sp. B2a2-09]